MSDILLESGTNELELLIFTVGSQKFGVNIAKVTEIKQYQKLTEIPASKEGIDGVFTSRDKVIPVINLHTILQREKSEDLEGLFLVCHFNGIDITFHVTAVQGIQCISWEAIGKPPEITQGSKTSLITGIVKIGEDIICILDFERIVSELNATAVLDLTGIEENNDIKAAEKHIVIAEDSTFLNTMIVETLGKAGYTKVTHFENGKAAWEYLEGLSKDEIDISCVISDIEMPQMDGHNLCKRIKSHDNLKDIPVYLFSSLINDQMYAKGESVGADAQFAKPQINTLIEYLQKNL